MNCPQCGAKMKQGELKCQFCGSVDVAEDRRRFKKEIQAIDHQINELDTLPKRLIKFISKKATLITIGVLLLIVVIYFGRSIVVGTSHVKELEARDEKKEVLEKYFKVGEYEKMFTYYNEQEDMYGAIFQKYYEVGMANCYIQSVRASADCLNGGEEMHEYGIWFALHDSLLLLNDADSAIKDSVPRENEDILEEFVQEVLTYYRESIQLTQEEIDALLAIEFDGIDSKEYEFLQERTQEILQHLELNQ